MNETIIKEIKSIYSSGILSKNQSVPEQKNQNPHNNKKTFFNGVIEKLNITRSSSDKTN